MNQGGQNKQIGQKGAAVVEFAILLLLLLVLLFGLIDFGFIWLQSHYIANAAREGARVASKSSPQSFPSPEVDTKIENAVVKYLQGVYDSEVLDDVSCCSKNNSGSLFQIVAKKGYIVDGTFLEDSSDPDASQGVQVELTVKSEDIHEPIIWHLLSLIGEGGTEIKQITERAVFVFETE